MTSRISTDYLQLLRATLLSTSNDLSEIALHLDNPSPDIEAIKSLVLRTQFDRKRVNLMPLIIFSDPTPSDKQIQTAQEQKIILSFIKIALEFNFQISLHNGGDTFELENETDFQTIKQNLFQTDHDEITLTKTINNNEIHLWFFAIYGNSPEEIFCNHSNTDLAHVLIELAIKSANT